MNSEPRAPARGDPDGVVLITSMPHCPRCRGSHRDIKAQRFRWPVESDGQLHTHWATCPDSGDPILIRVILENESG